MLEKDRPSLPCRTATTLSPEDIEAVAARVVSMIGERFVSIPTPTTPNEDYATRQAPADQPSSKLAYTKKELCAALSISSTTLWRLEARGLLKPVAGMRHRIYSQKEVERFLATKRDSW